MIKLGRLALLGVTLAGYMVINSVDAPVSQGASLRDLIKRAPELYLPSQLIPGKKATFTVKGQVGQSVRVVVSSTQSGATLPNGISLQTGKPVVEATTVIPQSGVASVELTLSPESEDLIPGDLAYVDAVVWRAETMADAQRAQIMTPGGENSLAVAEEADAGAMLVVPGDSSMTRMIRAVTTLGEANSDPRKRQLLDDGTINQNRPIDRTLNVAPASQTGF